MLTTITAAVAAVAAVAAAAAAAAATTTTITKILALRVSLNNLIHLYVFIQLVIPFCYKFNILHITIVNHLQIKA